MKLSRYTFLLIPLLISTTDVKGQLSEESVEIIKKNLTKWNLFVREKNIDELWKKLSTELKPSNILFRNVNLIDLKSRNVQPEMDILVSGGLIVKVGKKITIPAKMRNVTLVDSRGKYILPGLTDAHVHMGSSNTDKLLNLITGVTTVREMAASPWMIGYRNEVSENRILAPNIYLAGKMLNQSDLWFFSEIIKDQEDARKKVKQQKELGYDYIKVWNVLDEDILKIIANECQKQEMDLVGHVPHNISVQTALARGFRTLEHYKGVIIDQTLQLTREDFVSALTDGKNQPFWLCPTMALGNDGLRGKKAYDFLNSEPVKYVPIETMEKWRFQANSVNFQSEFGNVSDSVFQMSKRIFRQLHGKGIKYIAGTDTNGSNLFMVPGFDLHREIKLMNQLGMSTYEALQTATFNAAEAMRKLDEFGTIEVGKRADLILLESNPLDDLENLLFNNEVMVRGIWLDMKKITEIQKAVETIYSNKQDFFADSQLQVKSLMDHFLEGENKYYIKPISYYLFSEALLEAKANTQAKAVMETAVSHYPEYWMFDQLGKSYDLMGEKEKARKNYEQSMKLYPYGSTAMEWLQKN